MSFSLLIFKVLKVCHIMILDYSGITFVWIKRPLLNHFLTPVEYQNIWHGLNVLCLKAIYTAPVRAIKHIKCFKQLFISQHLFSLRQNSYKSTWYFNI